MKSLNTTTFSGDNIKVYYDKEPDICPICHTSLYPEMMTSALCGEDTNRDKLQIVFQCTKSGCHNFFIATYIPHIGTKFFLDKLSPLTPKIIEFTESINELSPTFVEIFNQAITAESMGLKQLTGIGLRKALEFLIKDFAIKQCPDDEEKIKNMFLGKCIENYIEDARLKGNLKRATWIGNDETHYTKKWEDKDIKDLKLLIKISLNMVEGQILSDKYEQEMPE